MQPARLSAAATSSICLRIDSAGCDTSKYRSRSSSLEVLDGNRGRPLIGRAPNRISARSCFSQVQATTNATSKPSQRATAQDAATMRWPSQPRHSRTTDQRAASHACSRVAPRSRRVRSNRSMPMVNEMKPDSTASGRTRAHQRRAPASGR